MTPLKLFWVFLIFAVCVFCFPSAWGSEDELREALDDDVDDVESTPFFALNSWSPSTCAYSVRKSRSFLKDRSNSMNPNNPTFNPNSQPRGSGHSARRSKAKAARANEILRESSSETTASTTRATTMKSSFASDVATAGLFGGTVVLGRDFFRKGLSSTLEIDSAKDVAVGTVVGAAFSGTIGKIPYARAGIGAILAGHRIFQRTSIEKSESAAVIAAEEISEAGVEIGVCTASTILGGILGSFVPVVGNVVGIAAAGFACGAVSGYVEGVARTGIHKVMGKSEVEKVDDAN